MIKDLTGPLQRVSESNDGLEEAFEICDCQSDDRLNENFRVRAIVRRRFADELAFEVYEGRDLGELVNNLTTNTMVSCCQTLSHARLASMMTETARVSVL